MSRLEAAAFTGLSVSAFDKARRDGHYPGPTLPGGKFDRRLLEKRMDEISGIQISAGGQVSPLDEWRERRGARKN